MNAPLFRISQIQDEWHAVFAYRVFHRSPEEWLKMRWGFNSAALLDEALDRYKLFIESKAINEMGFQNGLIHNNVLVMRGVINPAETGVKMLILGKSWAPKRDQVEQLVQQNARDIFSTFPSDFCLEPVRTEATFRQLFDESFFSENSNIVQIQRGVLTIPRKNENSYCVRGLWQSSSRSNEQIWRALSAMPQAVVFNIQIQPSSLLESEKSMLLDLKKNMNNGECDEEFNSYIPWVQRYVDRRLTPLKKYFLVQIHLISDGPVEYLSRSIGSALTRDSVDSSLPGYHVLNPGSHAENQLWREKLRLLEFAGTSSHMDDIADVDEVFSIFRFPYLPEAGIPGAMFEEQKK